MKKKIISLILCLVLVAALSSCGGNIGPSGEKQSINVYNWGEYIDQSVLDDFEAETGIHVNYTTYASNEEMYSKIVSGAASYDVIIPSEYMISKMISEDLLAELDFSNIPNYKYIGEEYKGLSYDPDEKYSVPYTWGTVVIVYNTKYVDEEDVADLIQECQSQIGKTLFNKNNKKAFWYLLEEIISVIEIDKKQGIRSILSQISTKAKGRVFTMDENALLYLIALVKEGLEHEDH